MQTATADDLTLFDTEELLAPGAMPKGSTIQERFDAFHKANPWVYRALETLTAQHVAKGRPRVGLKMLFEVVRWSYERRTVGSEFKVNNSFTSRYARLLIEKHPEWKDVFETRELRSA